MDPAPVCLYQIFDAYRYRPLYWATESRGEHDFLYSLVFHCSYLRHLVQVYELYKLFI